MAKILVSPGKYIIGANEIKNLENYAKPFGKNATVLITESGKERLKSELEEAFSKEDFTVKYEFFNRQCSKNEIDRVVKSAKENHAEMIIGIGGGKLLDTSKAVAYYLNIPVIIVPTIASTDAPCSALSVIYTEDDKFEEYLWLPHNPNVVLLDTEIVAKSPIRLTISGMGDALATYFEARAVKNKNAMNTINGKQTISAFALAELCYETLMNESEKAISALRAGVVTDAVDSLVEATTLLSGLGFESGGLAAAHAINNGFTTLEDIEGIYHGETVAFGTIAQLFLENADIEEIETVVGFCAEFGLPTTLEDLHITENVEEKVMKAATAACNEGESIYNMPVDITPEKVYAAIMAANSFGKEFF